MILKIYSQIVPEEGRQMLQFFGLDGVSFTTIDEFIANIPEEDNVIDMRINSPGGVVSEGWAIIDKLRMTGKEITATIEGQASSMAAAVLLAASKRKGYKHATLLIHGARYCDLYIPTATEEELERRIEAIREDNARLLDFMVERTGADRDTLEALMKEDKPISMEKAMELGFVHEILEPLSATADTNTRTHMASNKIATALNALAEALGLKVNLEADEAPVGYVLTSQDGTEINIEKAEGEDPAVGDKASPDGEHLMPDGKTIIIEDGVITEIREAEAPEENPEEETPAEDVAEDVNAEHEAALAAKDAELAEKAQEIETLQARINALEAAQMTDDQKVILAKVDKAGGRAWLDKTLQSGYVPAKRQRQEQTVENTSKISADLAEKKARRAARSKKTE